MVRFTSHTLGTGRIIQQQNVFTSFILTVLLKFRCNGGTFYVHLAELTRTRLVTQLDCTAAVL